MKQVDSLIDERGKFKKQTTSIPKHLDSIHTVDNEF
jgi:hypothetical protein